MQKWKRYWRKTSPSFLYINVRETLTPLIFNPSKKTFIALWIFCLKVRSINLHTLSDDLYLQWFRMKTKVQDLLKYPQRIFTTCRDRLRAQFYPDPNCFLTKKCLTTLYLKLRYLNLPENKKCLNPNHSLE